MRQYFRLISEKNPDTVLFEAVISQDKLVSLQNDSVLGWKPDDGRDMALSFEYPAALSDNWQQICDFQQRPPEFVYFGGHVKVALPEMVDPTTMPVIESSLAQYLHFNGLRGPLGDLILEQHYIPQLLDQFKMATDLDNEELIKQLFSIFRMLVLLNHRGILEELFSADMAPSVALIFERDPALADKRPDYHSFFASADRVQTVIPFKNDILDRMIQHTIRLQFFKDVVLPRHLDDEVYSTLTMTSRHLLNEIARLVDLQPEHYEYLSRLFLNENHAVRMQVLKFLKEFIAICKASNLRTLNFFKDAIFFEFLGFIQKILSDWSEANVEASLAAEMLLSLVQFEVAQVQGWMRGQSQKAEPRKQLLSVIIERFHKETNTGIRWHLVSVFRILLDPPGSTGINADALPLFEQFSDYYYANHALKMLSPLSQVERLINERRLTENEADHYFHLVELTSTFILLHKYKIKYLLVRDHILAGVCSLMRCHLAYIRLTSLRLFRTLVSVKDDFYPRIMLTSHLFEQLMETLRGCAHRNNLLRAAILDFFSALHATQYKKLIDYLVPKYRAEMEGYASLHAVFSRLLALYDSNYVLEGSQDASVATDMAMSSSQAQQESGHSGLASVIEKWGSQDFIEEDYFSSSNEADEADEPEARMQDEAVPAEAALDSNGNNLELPPLLADKEEEEFGGALGGAEELLVKPALGITLRNTLKTGFGLWKTNSASQPAPSPAPAPAAGSPSKKTRTS